MKKLIGLLLVAAACGGGGNNDPDGNPGGSEAVPMMITISGTASSRGLGGATPQSGVTIGAYASTDEATPLATAMTDAQGAFTVTITSNGTPINGFLKATKSGLLTSYLYPPTPISGNLMMVPMNMLASFDPLETLTGVDQLPGKAFVAMIVVGGSELTSPPVMGAAVSASPAAMQYRYNAPPNGLPSNSATTTHTDGIGYALNVTAGPVTVTATKSGSTFKSTMIKGHADALTQTLVIQ